MRSEQSLLATDQEINDSLQSMTTENIFASLYDAFRNGVKETSLRVKSLPCEVFS